MTHYPVISDSQGSQTNPNSGDVLADTGALGKEDGGGGIYEVTVTVGASAAATANVQHRDTANAANVTDVAIVYVAAGDTQQVVMKFEAVVGERFRVTSGGVTGTQAAFIQAQRIG